MQVKGFAEKTGAESTLLMPAQAGIQETSSWALDSGLRWGDGSIKTDV
jgi:hypothetical protein